MSKLGNNGYTELDHNNLAQPQQNLMKCNVMYACMYAKCNMQ